MSNPAALRTRIYVDGYNLYYGCLKRTPYKWLDLGHLFDQVLNGIIVNGVPLNIALATPAIKYFTAPILKNFAKAKDSVSSQAQYHHALRGHLGEALQIVEGYYDSHCSQQYPFIEGQAPLDREPVPVWKLEEKQSDVALALHALSDALRGEVDHVVVVSNDTDLAPALTMIREQTAAIVGVVLPTRDGTRPGNATLRELGHWKRDHLADAILRVSQLPPVVVREGRAIRKPLSWYPRPDLLEPIFDEAKRVRGGAGSAWKWLLSPAERLGGRLPVEMASTDEGAAELQSYMETYAREFGIQRE